MPVKVLTLIAVAAFLAACGSTPEESSDASGQGTSASSQTTAGPGTSSATVSREGTGGPAAGSPEQFVVDVGDRIFFDFDQSAVRPDQEQTLRAQAAWLKRYPQYRITVEGHADERGTREYNLALGERRANSVREYLVSLGVSPDRIDTISYGKERPAVLGSNEEAWAQNRRGVTVLRGGPTG